MLKFLIVLLVSSNVYADTIRLDVGVYSASSWWRGAELRDFSSFSDGRDDANTFTHYERLTYSTDISKKLNMSVFGEFTSTTMNDFSNTGLEDGDDITGLSAIGFDFGYSLWRKGRSSIDLTFGVTAPGDGSLDESRFISVNDGQTRYNFGLDYSIFLSSGKLDLSGNYIYRPGAFNTDPAGDNQSFDIPDILEVGAAYYHFIKRSFFHVGFTHSTSLGGIDIGPDSAKWRNNTGRAAFPATREERGEAYIGYGLFYSKEISFDITYTKVLTGRNTDRGQGLNFGLTKSL